MLLGKKNVCAQGNDDYFSCNLFLGSPSTFVFFKEKEANLNNLLNANITDGKMRRAIEEVTENLKKEINDALGE